MPPAYGAPAPGNRADECDVFAAPADGGAPVCQRPLTPRRPMRRPLIEGGSAVGLRSSNVAAFAIGALLTGVVGTGAAVAATGQLVNVADPSTGVAAKVSSSGRLLV